MNAQTHEQGSADSLSVRFQLVKSTAPRNEPVEEDGQEDRSAIDNQEFELGDFVGSLS